MKIDEISELEFRRYVLKRLKKLDDYFDSIWEDLNPWKDGQTQIVDEALDKAARAQRAVNRLKRDFEDHEHEE